MLRRIDLRSQTVDRVSSFLGGSLIVVGSVVLMLLAIWLLQDSPALSYPLGPIEFGGAGGKPGNPSDEQPEIAGLSGLELQPVSLESDLQAMVETAQEVGASSIGLGESPGAGQGNDPRSVGDGDGIGAGNDQGEPQRWKLRLEASNAKQYAEQLDMLGIELGCVGGGVSVIEYATNLSVQPTRREGTSAEEKRMFFAWYAEGKLQDFERSLLQAAGIETQGRLTLKFISRDLQDKMQQLELQAAVEKGHQLKQIHTTLFRVDWVAGEARISVDRQLLHP